jgi:hypothetical protein
VTGVNPTDEIELAIRALRTRVSRQRQKAADGISSAGEHFPGIFGIFVRAPEAAMAANLAAAFERIAAEIEAGAPL